MTRHPHGFQGMAQHQQQQQWRHQLLGKQWLQLILLARQQHLQQHRQLQQRHRLLQEQGLQLALLDQQ